MVAEGGTIGFAPPGRGKSYLAMLLAQSVEYGIDAVWSVARTPTLYVNLERSRDSMERRLGQVNAALGLDRTTPARMLHRRGRSLSDVIEAVARAVDEEGIGLVILDSLSRAGVGDLTENMLANRAMDQLNGLGCGWFALAHTPRADDGHVYGSQMFDAAADITVQVLSERRDSDLGIGLKVTKANDIAPPPLRVWCLEFDPDFGLTAIRPAEAHEFPEITQGDSRTTRDLVIDHLRVHGTDYTRAIAEEIGRAVSGVSAALKDTKTFLEVDRQSNRVLYGLRSDREG